MELHYLTLLVLAAVFNTRSTEASRCSDEPPCDSVKSYGMLTSDCSKRHFEHFPKCHVRSNVEALDLSVNRLRRINNEDLTKYTSLKFLYLNDNLILKIEPDAFTYKTTIGTLDLSKNGLRQIPKNIFQLPALQNLYLQENTELLPHLNNTLVTSPLKRLDLSRTYDEIPPTQLPSFGIVPELLYYNVSEMNILLKPASIAGFCNLQFFYFTKERISFEDECDCWNMKNWLDQRIIEYTKFDCKIEEDLCSFNITEEDQLLYNQCSQQYAEIVQQRTVRSALTITGIVVGICLVLFIILMMKLRRDRIRRKKKAARSTAYNKCAKNSTV